MSKKGKDKKKFAVNKLAFDTVMSRVRAAMSNSNVHISTLSAAAQGAKSPGAPTFHDFIADVDLATKKVVPNEYRVRFDIAYTFADFDDDIVVSKLVVARMCS